MKVRSLALASFFTLAAAAPAALLACGAQPPSQPSANPLGGTINTGGAPDVGKTAPEGSSSLLGGPVNTGGTPDVGKSKPDGGPSIGGPVNTGGAPDVKKSDPKGALKK